MILTKTIKVKITKSNIYHYMNVGYMNISLGDIIDIPVELLTNGSHRIIKCKCDKCGKEKDIQFKNYIRYYNKWGTYKCRKCVDKERIKTILKQYNVLSPVKIKKKMK